MLYLICSDIHGSKNASEMLVFLDNKYHFKKIICLGDVGYSGARNIPPVDYSPIDVYKNLALIKSKLIMISGNCDSRVDSFVLGLKFYMKKKIRLGNHMVFLSHGDLYSYKDFPLKANDMYFYGHTHVYEMSKIEGFYVFNPGSTTLPKVNKEKTYMIYDSIKDTVSLYTLEGNLIKIMAL